MPRPGRPWVETDPTENWTSITDPKIRRRLQNRLNARAHRRRRALEREQETQAQPILQSSSTSSPPDSRSLSRGQLQVLQYLQNQKRQSRGPRLAEQLDRKHSQHLPEPQQQQQQQQQDQQQDQHQDQHHYFLYAGSHSLPTDSRATSPTLSISSVSPSSPASTQISDLANTTPPPTQWDYCQQSQSQSSSFSAIFPESYTQLPPSQASSAFQSMYSSPPRAPVRLERGVSYSVSAPVPDLGPIQPQAYHGAAATTSTTPPTAKTTTAAAAALESPPTTVLSAPATGLPPLSAAASALLALSAPTSCSTCGFHEPIVSSVPAVVAASTTGLEEWMIPWDASWLTAAGQEMESPFSMAVYVGAGADLRGAANLRDGTHRGSVDVFSDSTMSTQGSPGSDVHGQGEYVAF